jgi:hypothetical protein
MLAYALDSIEKKAVWASNAARPDGWTAQYVGEVPRRGKLGIFYPDWLPFQFLLNDAPVVPLTPPTAELLDSSVEQGSRTLHLLVSSPRHGRTLTIRAPETDVLESWVNGKALGKPADARWNSDNVWSLGYANVPPQGIDLKLRVRGTEPVLLVLIDRSPGLPEVPGQNFFPRPAESMPEHTGDQTMVLTRLQL